MAQWLERSVGDREVACEFDPDFLQPILKYSTFFSVFLRTYESRVRTWVMETFYCMVLFYAFE